MRVDRTGTFKVAPLEYGVAKTQNGFPTFNVKAKLLAFYDEQEKEWIDWQDYDMEATAFLCLFGYKKGTTDLQPTLNHTQVMNVFGWNGESFAELANGNYDDLVFQMRIVNNDPEYADKNPFVVGFIDVEDAEPGNTIKKLDADGVKDLDKQFAALLKKSGKGKTAASAPKTEKPKVPPKTTSRAAANKAAQEAETATEETKKPTPEEKKAALLEKSRKNLEAAKKKDAAPPPRTKKTTPPKKDLPEGKSTKRDAWMTIVELKRDDVDDDKLNEVWNAAIDEVAGEGVDDKDVTEEQWFEVREKVLDQVAKF